VGGPLDPHVGSCIRASQEKAREFGRGDHEIARSDIPTIGGQCGPQRDREWSTGGTETLGSRREKSRSIGVRIRESRSAESLRFVWTRGRA
jgi:hypothetical protein